MYTILNIKFYYVYNIRILPTVAAAGNESPDELMQVMMPLLENEICNQLTWHNHSLDDSMVCAGYEENGLGNCNVSFSLLCIYTLYDAVLMRRQSGIAVTGGSMGEDQIRPCSHPICQWDLAPQPSKIFYHTEMAHNLVSVHSVFFQPHSSSKPITINNIHIIDLVYYKPVFKVTILFNVK